ncbi:protein-export membrane protein secd [Asticcacaulis sp. AC460]|uniref:protein translocase subunit SecD n=1 Tax=Asticcacaulis sp. AC460 TaxID=1282360 RepID=UPI0003C3AE96|nr:protein translocase subunit SecD [Asticcacaulis sp. AC460]ESQ91720.1 protein-export membrane protein secd [Asticcacaulis sp. AC460]
MMTLSRWKVGLVLIATLLGILFSVPNFLPQSVKDSLPGFIPAKGLNLGLDLQGGSYLLVEVDTVALQKERLNNLAEQVRTDLVQEKIISTNPVSDGTSVRVRITNANQVDAAFAALNRLPAPVPNNASARDITVSRGPDQTIVLALTDAGIRATSVAAVDTSIEIVRRRIDELGTKEPSIARQGTNRIVVEAPGESDPEQLKEVIGTTAQLTFHMVDESVTPEQAAAGQLPPGTKVLPDASAGGQPLAIRKLSLVSGKNLVNATVERDEYNQPAIGFAFDGEGSRIFGDITRQNIGHRFAIVLDNEILTAPVIRGAITGGKGQISGGGLSQEEASLKVKLLKGGALPAPLKFEQQRTVTAELGADAVQKGAVATVIAVICVVIFMLLAYGFLFGGIAVVALLVNLVLLIGGMSVFQFTLTLPGIAGLILTLAMAVDANVLIYERMRDEMRAGRKVIDALDAGFSRAMETIIDANVTSLAAAIIMWSLGAGPVKGFAVTLVLGIVTSVFSAVLISQVLLAVWFRAARPKTLPIADNVKPRAWPLIKVLPQKTNFTFVKFARLAGFLSVVAVAASLFLAIYPATPPCGGLACGVDFKGGSALDISTGTQPLDLAKLRETMSHQGLKGVQVQGVGGGTAAQMKFETPGGDPIAKVEQVKLALKKEFPSATFSNTEVVGAKVSGELLTGGITALFLAIALMMVYIWFRFEWQFGLGAVVALFHDVILTFGLFALFKLEFDLRAVAAILTIIGYSMNDTVVVFDRLRENLRKYKKMALRDLIDLSINETLSRTIITGVTAIMALTGLAVLGGETLFSFSVAMIFGIFIGTYSSVYVAAPVILLWGVNRNQGDAEVVDLGGFKGNKKPQTDLP